MAMHKPVDPIGITSRSEVEVEADARLFAELERHLSTDILAQGVRNFHQAVCLDTVEGALGGPELLTNLLDLIKEEHSGAGVDSAKLRSELQTHYEQFAQKLSGEAPEDSSQWVDEEVETAKHELTRHWIDLLHSAGKMWGFPVKLDALLRPVPSQEQVKPWLDIYVDRREALYAALALGKSDMRKLSNYFAGSVRTQLQSHRSLHLPLRMEVALGPKGEFLVTQRSAEERQNPNQNPRKMKQFLSALRSFFSH